MNETTTTQELDDTQGHRMPEVGEHPVEGRRRPHAAGDDDDVRGHKQKRLMDDGEDEDVLGHKQKRLMDDGDDDVLGHKQKRLMDDGEDEDVLGHKQKR